METIGDLALWSFGDDGVCRQATNPEVRRSKGCVITSFRELADKVAELQFRNPGYVHLFRGQAGDYREDELSTLKPSIFRTKVGQSINEHNASLTRKFRRLKVADNELARRYEAEMARLGKNLIKRFRIVRWAILQHYEVCATPLLDVTHSLRVATSFASHNPRTVECFIFVLGIPHLSGAISVSAESGTQLVRLASVCPPTSMRPHLQEGYLLGEYPDIHEFDQKSLYRVEEVDFGHRLLAKFRFEPRSFGSDETFPMIPKPALYPKEDPILKLTKAIRAEARRQVPPQ